MDKQSMYNDYIDANKFKRIMTDDQLNMTLAVKLNLYKARLYKRHQVEFISHENNEFLLNKSIESDQLRNYYVWNAIKTARFEKLIGIDLVEQYDDYIDYLIDKYGLISESSLNEMKILMAMYDCRKIMHEYRLNQEIGDDIGL